jgi:hypothetical protein
VQPDIVEEHILKGRLDEELYIRRLWEMKENIRRASFFTEQVKIATEI